MTLPNLIIGGTYKAGTTSVFSYLSDHPQVCGSNIKETDFFVSYYTGDHAKDEAALGRHFRHCADEAPIRLEASAGYLARADIVAERIKKLIGDPKIIFILRDPSNRLYSYFNYLIGELSIPSSITFDEYVRLALSYDAGELARTDIPFDPGYLAGLRHGRYSQYLEIFFSAFEKGSIKVTLFEELEVDARAFMLDLSRFAGIDPLFYENYKFERVNTTFFSKNTALHRLAILINKKFERFTRQRPTLKMSLVAAYKRFNMAQQGYKPMSSNARKVLAEYYAADMASLDALLGSRVSEHWRKA